MRGPVPPARQAARDSAVDRPPPPGGPVMAVADPLLAAEALPAVGVGDRLGHRPGELSGGEQQRVAIARALINEPRLILADEPTGNLDPKTSEVIYDLFLRLQAERGIAFLIATHNQELARKADRGYRLVDGHARPFDAQFHNLPDQVK